MHLVDSFGCSYLLYVCCKSILHLNGTITSTGLVLITLRCSRVPHTINRFLTVNKYSVENIVVTSLYMTGVESIS